ncbi:DNRLRE domain-containing protein [Botrimarina sp.]|uniref:DNRLRE domain-containing protein n=1 Tax=Botrimarina sp. TaxID=2795802 RepID=UPI0032EEA25B
MTWRPLRQLFSRTPTFLLPACVASLACLQGMALAETIGVADDTWVREDNADSNRNGNDEMNARTDLDGDDNDVILLRFPTAGLPAGVSDVSLNLFWQRNDSSTANELKLYGLNESDPDETLWDEETVTYNNAPGLIPDGVDPTAELGGGASFDEIQDLDVANLTLLVASQPYGPQEINEPYSFSSAALDAFLNADTNGEVTFLILRANESTSGNQARFWPKESGPGATLTFVPEPGTAGLVLLAGLAAVRRSR